MRIVWSVVVAVLTASTTVRAQPVIPEHPVAEWQPFVRDSGAHANPAGRPEVVYEELVSVPDTASLRLYFDEAVLPAGGSVRMTSVLDLQVQELDADGLELWGLSSGYFNGGAVIVELVAGPHTDGSRLVIGSVEVEPAGGGIAGEPGECGICGTSDDRVPSDEPWIARLPPDYCTASVFNRGSCMITAGHCLDAGATSVAEFNVPPSSEGSPKCPVNHPPISDQFPIAFEEWVITGELGGDWGLSLPGPNNLGQLPYERYGAFRPIAPEPAVAFQTATLTGYGYDDTVCALHRTQQTHSGPITSVFPTYIRVSIDLRVGNSGSPIVVDGKIVAVATHCPCPNIGTRVDVPAFAASRQFHCTSCGDPDTGSCFTARATPFCEEQDCCLLICDTDPACCDTAWDAACVDLAIGACDGTIANDDCASASPIVDGDTAFTTVGATTSPPPLGAGIVADTWYLYVPTCAGTLTVSTCDQADLDTVLAAYTGACDDLTLIAGNDDGPGCTGGTSSMDVPITCAVPVLIRVGGAAGNGSGTLSLTCDVGDVCPPDNNVCALAEPIDDSGTVFDNTNTTTDGPSTSACVFGTVHNDLWYAYVAPCEGTVTVDLCGSDFDTRIAVYAQACPGGPGEAIACDDNSGCGQTSVVSFPATSGTTYLLRVGGIAGATGAGQISIVNSGCADPPANDNCTTSSSASVGTTPFTTIGATTDGPVEACGDRIHHDIWYRLIVGDCIEPVTISVCNAEFDTRIAVYGSTCPTRPGTAIACNDDACGSRSQLTFMPTASVHRVRVGGAFGATGSGDLLITCGAVEPPCDGDTNGDGAVDVNDLTNVITDWGTDGTANGGDLTGAAPGSPPDGMVDVNDLNVVVANWGLCP